MKKSLLIACLSFFTLGLLAQKTAVVNDPNAEVRKASGFHTIKVSHAFDVYITQSTEEAVAVSATKQEYKNNIIVEVKDGILSVSYDNPKKWKGWNSDKMDLKVYISFKDIKKLSASGACNVHLLTPIKVDELALDFSGATDMKNADIQVNKLKVEVSGASDVQLKGRATEIKVDASGASDFKSMDFQADYCDVEASGASTIHITVNKELSARASGASDIKYKGEGLIRNIHTSGASSVSRKS